MSTDIPVAWPVIGAYLDNSCVEAAEMPDLEAKLSREHGETSDNFRHFSNCVVLTEFG